MKVRNNTNMTRVTLVAYLLAAINCVNGTDTGTLTTIGKHSITCITFDKPLLKWNGDFKASQGVRTKNFGVDIQKKCGLDGDCGRFRVPSKIEIPYFKNNDFFDFSVSVWFKRQGGSGCWPVLVSNGDCQSSTIQINSVSDTQLMVTVRDSTAQTYKKTFQTDSQSSEWRHVVVTVHVDKMTHMGWAKVYIDGKKVDSGFLSGNMPPVWFPMFIGANDCGPCSHYYNGLMDSISFARYALTSSEVRKLYESRGLCIGLPGEIKLECGRTWALIVAGSRGYSNYRHQADACHAYRIMRNRGIPEERIVLMIYDDIAYNPSNPDQGQIFNRPNGPNVYDVKIDYKGNDVTAANFLNVLRGNMAAMNGIGSGKVINSGRGDNVFVFYTNHGGPGILAFPSGPLLTATGLNSVISQMHVSNKYKQMVFYIEACCSGSMLHNILPNDMNVYATTASGPTESSYAYYWSSYHSAYLGDEYSIYWMEDSDVKDIEKETIKEQFIVVKAHTKKSTVHEYGQLSVSNNPVADFQSGKRFCYRAGYQAGYQAVNQSAMFIGRPASNVHTRGEPDRTGVRAEDVPLALLRHKLADIEREGEHMLRKKTLMADIKKIEQTREAVRGVFADIVKGACFGDRRAMEIISARHTISDFGCYKAAMELFIEKCFSVSEDQYAMLQLQTLVNLCEEGVPKETIFQSISSVCHSDLDRSMFSYHG